tara:strand:- start:8649 stop:9320 length:672 start_codon:yes stop_codon:yes gene_type:complete
VGYLNKIVKKPWGYEYLVFENKKVAIWFLHILYNQQTSMHCHPNKTTGLILLDGHAEISFLTNTISIKSLEKVMIRKGLFHSTKSISRKGASIFEIETPVDKHDLVRLEDKYGRKAKPYEGKSAESDKGKNDLTIKTLSKDKVYDFANCIIEVKHINDTSIFNKMHDPQNIIFLDGGILTESNILVAQAGDVVTVYALKKLTKLFPKVDRNTKIMIINSNGKL